MNAAWRQFAGALATSVALLSLLHFSIPAADAQERTPRQGTRETIKNPLNDLLEQARRDIEHQDFQAAIEPLKKIIAEQDDFAYAHFQLAYAYTALKRTREARAEYEKTIALDPKMPEAGLNLGILLLDDDPSAAVAPLEKAVALLPMQSRPRFLLGVAHERSGNLKAAAESYVGALRLDPSDSETSLHLAHVYLKLDRLAEAEARFRAVLSAEPQSQPALLGLAQSLELQNKPEAVEAYENYLNLHPEDSAARQRLVHFLIARENYDAALALLEKQETGKPPSLELLKLRADVQIGQKKWDDAIATLRQALDAAPADPQLHGGLGRVHLQKRDFPAAERELKTAIQADRGNLQYWKDLGSTYYLAGDYASALGVFDTIAKVEPPTAGVWFLRALCYDNLKQAEQALDAYRKFLALDENKNPDQVWQAKQRIEVLQRVVGKKH